MQIKVGNCEECPFLDHYDYKHWPKCGVPDGPSNPDKGGAWPSPPKSCPIRRGPITVMLEEDQRIEQTTSG
jgi:hypothetical protein